WAASCGLVFLLGVTGAAHAATITLDGGFADWAGISPAATDPAGDFAPDSGDVLAVYFTQDATHLYFRIDTTGDPQMGSNYLDLDTDNDSATGCAIPGIGIEFGIGITSPTASGSNIGDARDCMYGDDFPGALQVAFGATFLEGSVALATLRMLTPGFDGSF